MTYAVGTDLKKAPSQRRSGAFSMIIHDVDFWAEISLIAATFTAGILYATVMFVR
jgi:hypothetical protein